MVLVIANIGIFFEMPISVAKMGIFPLVNTCKLTGKFV